MSEGEGKKIKVTDRRIFAPNGELREEPAPQPAGSPPARGDDAEGEETVFSQPDSAPAAGGVTGSIPEPTFAHLVAVLAEPIALFLGDVELPEGQSVANLDLARFHIDLLDLLRRKTEGNVTREERAALEDLLYQLRMRYVQKRD